MQKINYDQNGLKIRNNTEIIISAHCLQTGCDKILFKVRLLHYKRKQHRHFKDIFFWLANEINLWF